MDSISRQISCTKCALHPLFSCDMLLLDPSVNQHKVCSKCIVERKLFERVFPIPDLLNSKPCQKQSIYPLVDDENLQNMLRTEQDLQSICLQIEDYYSKLQSEIQAAIKIQMQKDCQKIQKNITEWNLQKNKLQNLLSTNDQLKQLLQSKESNSEIQLHEYIVKRNFQVINEMQEIQNSFEKIRKFKGSFTIELPHIIQTDIINQIQMIELFNIEKQQINSLSQQIAEQQQCVAQKWDFSNMICLPSENYGKSKQYLFIQRQNNSIVVTNMNSRQGCAQCYLFKALEQNKKYVISLELNSIFKYDPEFQFGLIQTVNKDTQHLVEDKISYKDSNYSDNGGTIIKVIKRNQPHSNNKSKIEKKRFEIRIHLKDKIIKVSFPPNYEKVVEIIDKNLIDLSKEYFFAISLFYPQDSVEIQSVVEVSSFTNEM